MNRQELREQFEKEFKKSIWDSKDEFDIDYVRWLEDKVLNWIDWMSFDLFEEVSNILLKKLEEKA